jgi:hypothetical protein
MAAKEKEYHRLPGVGTRGQGLVSAVAIRSRLWLGKDHLLGVDSQVFSEDYKRFYYRDIQAVILRKSARGGVINAVFGGLAVIPTAIGVVTLSQGSTVGTIVAGSFTGLFLLAMLVNVAMGPTSVCHLRTAVQTEELPSLNRVRRARKVLDRLRPLIAQAQGQLSPEEISSKMQELALAPTPTNIQRSVLNGEASDAPPRIVG